MGNDTSKAAPGAAPGAAVVQDPEEVSPYAYTSASVPKPAYTPASPAVERVIVVSKANTPRKSLDPALQALQRTPVFRPILKSSEGFTAEEVNLAASIEPKHLVNICMRYQAHLRAGAEHTATEQARIPPLLKAADRHSAHNAELLGAALRKSRAAEEGLQNVDGLVQSVKKAEETVLQILPLLAQLNHMLPDDARLEPFVVSTNPAAQLRSPQTLRSP